MWLLWNYLGHLMRRIKNRSFLVILFCLVTFLHGVKPSAAENAGYIAIIIDDLGSSAIRAEQLIKMPAQLTYSFLPHTPYAEKYAFKAHELGKEVMLHLPMKPEGNKDMGPGGLSEGMSHAQFITTVREAIHAIPFAVGVNNHMGSLLTRSVKDMHWLMQELKARTNLYFVDSRTHGATVAAQMADRNHLQNASRDIFLDHVIEKEAIDVQFQRLLNRVSYAGHALAIGHPHTLTIEALTHWINIIEERGIKIVPVSEYIQLIEGERRIWQASLSLSRKAAKN